MTQIIPLATARNYFLKILIWSLAIAAAYSIVKGSTCLLQAQDGANNLNDLKQRYDEWRLFRQGIYPSANLADVQARSLPYFRTTVYLPWALPIFGLLFTPGGFLQGQLFVWAGSLFSLILIAAIGWRLLRPWGQEAGWLGALAPLAIANNNLSLCVSQFSIVCMGLISLQWIALRRERPLHAGLYWALAMIKPQISVFFAIPLLRRRHLPGLILGSSALLALSAIALAFTKVAPSELMRSWLNVVPTFAGDGTKNLLAIALRLTDNIQWPILMTLSATVILVIALLAKRIATSVGRRPGSDLLDFAGLFAIAGFISFYHRGYDNIMLFPALLACLRESVRKPTSLNLGLSILMASTLWMPESLWNAIPNYQSVLMIVWSVVGLVLLHRVAIFKSIFVKGVPRP